MSLSGATLTTERRGYNEVSLPDSYLEPRWYAAHLCANREKRVAAELNARNVENFLPLYTSVRRWKDRRVNLDLPLFPGYVFVRLALRDRLRVQLVPGVARLVGFDGTPAALPPEDINRIRAFLAQGLRAEPHPFLRAGRRARVLRGPLAGIEGIVLRRKNRSRLVLSFHLIQRSVAIEMDQGVLAPL